MHNNLLSHMTVHETYVRQEVKVSMKASFKPHGTYCLSCNKDFAGKKELDEHFSKVHAEGKLKCEMCFKQFTSKYTLQQHVQVEHKGKRYACTYDDCREDFKCKDQLEVHLMKHEGKFKFECTICKKGFYQKAHFTGHLNSHLDSQPHWVSKCGKQFLYQQDVGKHLDRCGIETKDFECTLGECKGKKFFMTKQQLRNHYKTYHKLGDPFVCDKCGYTTFYQHSYELHIQNHK